MRRLLLAILMLAWAGQAWGASTTYYVSPSGDNTDGSTWAKAYRLPSQAVTAGASVAPTAKTPGAGHIMYVAPGTYNSNLTLSNANWVGGTVIGTADNASTAYAVMDQVKLEYTGTDHACNPGVDNLTIRNLGLKSTGAAKDGIALTSTNTVLSNIHAYDSTRFSFHSSGGTTFTVTNSWFSGSGTNTVHINVTGVSGSFNYCIITPSQTTASLNPSARLYQGAHGSGTVTFNNCIIEGVQYTAAPIYQTGAGATTFNNCVIMGAINPDTYTAERTAGTLTINNSYVGANWYGTHRRYTGTVVESGNIYQPHPYFTQHLYKGMAVLCVDDYTNNDVVSTLSPIFSGKGLKGTWYVESDDATASAGTKAIVQAVIDAGIFEVGVHSRTHSDLNRAVTDVVFSITKASADITIDRATAGGTITISGAGTVTGFKAKTLGAIRTELTALGCTVGNYLSNQDNTALGEIIADLATAASPQNALYLIDATAATGLYKVEVKDAYDTMAANFTGYTPYSFATPYGTTNVNLEAAVAAAGFISNRIAKSDARAEMTLTNIDLMQLGYYANTDVFTGVDDNTTIQYISDVYGMLADKPAIIFNLGHGVAEYSIANWTILANTAASFNSIFKYTAYEAANYIKTSGLWSTADDRTYTRTFTNSSDYRLKIGSPLINAGVDVGLTTDYRGKAVPVGSAPDIGAYEFGPGDPGYGRAYRGRMGIHWLW